MTQYSTRIKVRHYELDTLGHLNHAVYHQYGEVARLGWLEEAAGDNVNGLADSGVATVMLESTIRFRRELRSRDEVDVTCDVEFPGGKVFHFSTEIRKLDGTVSAEIDGVLGLMDLQRRKLVDNPYDAFRQAGLTIPGRHDAG